MGTASIASPAYENFLAGVTEGFLESDFKSFQDCITTKNTIPARITTRIEMVVIFPDI